MFKKVEKVGCRIKNWLKRNKKDLAFCLLMSAGMILLNTTGVLAGTTKVTENKITGVNDIISMVTTIVTAIGIIIALFGGANMGISYTQDNPDGISRGFKFFIGGIICTAVPQIIKWVAIK